MSPRSKYTLQALGWNGLAGLLLSLPLVAIGTSDLAVYWGMALLIIAPLSLLVQLVIGIIFTRDHRRRELGQAMLLSVGLILLIGLSVCGTFFLFV